MISLRNENEYFDEKNTVFGRVISGWDVIEKIMNTPREEELPEGPIIVSNCGEYTF